MAAKIVNYTVHAKDIDVNREDNHDEAGELTRTSGTDLYLKSDTPVAKLLEVGS
jgi:uncharacterized HAD superfamily protein